MCVLTVIYEISDKMYATVGYWDHDKSPMDSPIDDSRGFGSLPTVLCPFSLPWPKVCQSKTLGCREAVIVNIRLKNV